MSRWKQEFIVAGSEEGGNIVILDPDLIFFEAIAATSTSQYTCKKIEDSYDLSKDGWTKWEGRSCLLLPHEKDVQCFCDPAVKWLQKQVWSCVVRWLIHRLWLGLTMIDVFLGGGIAGQAQSLKHKDHITEPRPIWPFCGFALCFSEQNSILWSPLQQCRS